MLEMANHWTTGSYPWDLLRQCNRQGESCFAWIMCENEQNACKKIGYICLLFLPMKSK